MTRTVLMATPPRLCRAFSASPRRSSSFRELFPPIALGDPRALASRRTPIPTVGPDPPLESACEFRAGRQLPWLRLNLRDGCGTRPAARMPEGDPQWPRFARDPRACAYIYDPPAESKLAFVSEERYCCLCHEPVECAVRHCAWWDHVTRMVAIRLAATHPRRWDAAQITREAQTALPRSVMAAPRPHPFFAGAEASAKKSAEGEEDAFLTDLRSCFVFEREAVVRRAELAALLRVLCTERVGGGRDPPLCPALRLAVAGSAATSLGERTFRAFISEQVTVLLPPMAPEATTRFQQRCWGRKNLEAMFDLLGVAGLQRLVGATQVAETKKEKAAVLRHMFYDLATLLAVEENGNIQLHLLVELTLHRFAHELIHLHTMVLMEQIWEIYESLGCPTTDDMEESSFC